MENIFAASIILTAKGTSRFRKEPAFLAPNAARERSWRSARDAAKISMPATNTPTATSHCGQNPPEKNAPNAARLLSTAPRERSAVPVRSAIIPKRPKPLDYQTKRPPPGVFFIISTPYTLLPTTYRMAGRVREPLNLVMLGYASIPAAFSISNYSLPPIPYPLVNKRKLPGSRNENRGAFEFLGWACARPSITAAHDSKAAKKCQGRVRVIKKAPGRTFVRSARGEKRVPPYSFTALRETAASDALAGPLIGDLACSPSQSHSSSMLRTTLTR